MTIDQLKLCAPLCKKPEIWIDEINLVLDKFEINTPLRQAHFIAQILHESGSLNIVEENLYYSAKGLMAIFPKYFSTYQYALQFEKKPEMIANTVYANRLGNRDTKSGDGYKYRGRGILQITGQANYARIGLLLNTDFINKPELLATPHFAALSAGQYWSMNRLNRFADADDIIKVTKAINGGTIGIKERHINLDRCKKVLK